MAVQISGNDITVPRDGSFTRNVTIGGTLTYEDVTNIDSVGLVTARTGIEIGARPGVAASISVDGNMIVSGIATIGSKLGIGGITPSNALDVQGGTTNTAIVARSTDTKAQISLVDNSTTSVGSVVVGAVGDALFFTSGSGGDERLRITSDGKVGIGEDDPDGNYLLIRAASTVGTTKGHIMLTGDSATNGEGPQIVFSESGSGSSFAGAYIGHAREGSNSTGNLVFGTRATGGDASTVPTERLRITAAGYVGVGEDSPATVLHVKANLGDMLRLDRNNTGAVGNQIAFRHSNSGTLTETGSVNCVSTANADAGELRFSTKVSGGSNTEAVRIDSSGNLKFNSGYGSVKEAYGVRAWANYDHVAATVRGSAQLTSVTDTSTGRGTFNWAFTFVDQYYAAVGTSGGGGGSLGDDNAVTWASADHGTTTLTFRTDNFKTNANHDSDNLNVVIVR